MSPDMYLNFAVAMLAIVNPLGIIPLWSELTSDLSIKARREIALMLTLTAVFVLLVFLIFGREILELFAIDLPVFKVAGGMLLLFTGFSMVNGRIGRRRDIGHERGQTTFQVAKSRFRKILVPLGIPMLSGPGSLTTVVLFGSGTASTSDFLVLSGVLLFVLFLLFLAFYYSGYLEIRIDSIAFDIMTRLLGIIVTAIAIQFMTEGLGMIFPGWKS